VILKSPIDRQSSARYCVFIGGNIVSNKNKKQDGAEVEYRTTLVNLCG